MDVQTEEVLDQPYALVLEAILAESGSWLPGLVKDAADRLVTDLRVQFKGVHLAFLSRARRDFRAGGHGRQSFPPVLRSEL
jgi:hypothetical protein